MQVVINPGIIAGHIPAPSSKSMMQRACAAALLHNGETIITHPGTSNDDKAALQIIQQLGASIVAEKEDKIIIRSNGIHPVSPFIDCCESGLSARLFTPIAALGTQPIEVRGTGSLLNRPMESFAGTLPFLNVALPGFEGSIPFTVQGPLQARSIQVDGSISSQFLSGLLFAMTNAATEPVTVEVTDLKSKPYIDLTLEVLQHFGKPVTNDDYRYFHIDPARFSVTNTVKINIEGDWSSAAFLLVAGAISGDVTISNLSLQSKQADKAIIDVLKQAGANVITGNDSIQVKQSGIKPFQFDATNCPDLFPVLSVFAACCKGDSEINGLHRLFHKESNRAESIAEMLQQFGVDFSMEDDALHIYGTGYLEGATIDSNNDHRIVMAAAIGALKAERAVVIDGAEAINKSYPQFFEHLKMLGVKCFL